MFPLGDLFLFFVVDFSKFFQEFVDVMNVTLCGFECVLCVFEFLYFDEDISRCFMVFANVVVVFGGCVWCGRVFW